MSPRREKNLPGLGGGCDRRLNVCMAARGRLALMGLCGDRWVISETSKCSCSRRTETAVRVNGDPAAPARQLVGGSVLLAHVVRLLTGLAALVLVGACAAYALAEMFSFFADYDDQGFLMLTVRHMLRGARLYDDVPVPYGPVYYLERWLLHGALSVPLTHDAVRLVSALHWIGAALAAGFLAAAMTRGGGFPAAACALTLAASVLHLRAVANEPGHPQELAVLVVNVSLLAVAACGRARNRLRLGILGAASAGLALTKINLGAMYGLAVLGGLLLDVPRGRAAGLFRVVLVVAMAAFPVVVVSQHLDETWVQTLLALLLVGLLPGIALALRSAVPGHFARRELFAFLLGAGAIAGSGVLFIVFAGSSVSGAVRGFVIHPLAYSTMAIVPLPVSAVDCSYAVLSSATALAILIGRERVTRWLVPPAKLWFAAVTLAATPGWLSETHRPSPMLVSVALPWTWLVLVPPEGATGVQWDVLPRRLCALVACFMVLQMYPLAGSQISFGTATFIPVAMVCFSDALEALVTRLAPVRQALTRSRVTVVAVLGALVLIVPPSVRASLEYRRLTPLDLPGTRWLRLDADQVTVYRCLARNLHDLSDTFLFLNGSNSFYFWAKREPASLITVGHFWGLLTPDQQQRLLDDYKACERFVFVDAPMLFETGTTGREPLVRYIRGSFHPVAQLGPYTIMVPADRADAAAVPCSAP